MTEAEQAVGGSSSEEDAYSEPTHGSWVEKRVLLDSDDEVMMDEMSREAEEAIRCPMTKEDWKNM